MPCFCMHDVNQSCWSAAILCEKIVSCTVSNTENWYGCKTMGDRCVDWYACVHELSNLLWKFKTLDRFSCSKCIAFIGSVHKHLILLWFMVQMRIFLLMLMQNVCGSGKFEDLINFYTHETWRWISCLLFLKHKRKQHLVGCVYVN